MPVYQYTTIDSKARKARGIIRADSPRQARAMLQRDGMQVAALKSGREQPSSPFNQTLQQALLRFLASRQREQVLETFENLVTLLDSHVTLEAAWASVGEGIQQRRLSSTLLALHERVRAGESLSSALGAFPEHFDAVDLALVKAGEDAGDLSTALKRLIARRQMAGKLAATFAGALAYPTFLLILGCTVVVFLTSTVIPNIDSMLVAGGGKVPFITQLLVLFGKTLAMGIIPALGAVVLLIVFAGQYKAGAKRKISELLRKTPIVGTALLHWQLAQFCLVLRTLLASGVHLPSALELAGNASGEGPVYAAAAALRLQVLEGYAIADRRKVDESAFPPWLWSALSVGQESGDLVPVLERVGLRFEQAATKSAARVAAVLEPAMILLIGLFVGLVAYAALLPIVKLGANW